MAAGGALFICASAVSTGLPGTIRGMKKSSVTAATPASR